LIEYATKHQVDALLFSDLDVYESHDMGYLKEIRQEVKKQKIVLHAGTGGICPTSKSFKDKYGSAEEHLRLLIKVAEGVGSSVVRCYLGSSKDRKTEGGIRVHMASTIETLNKVKQQALDAGVRIAVENHAGDLHSRELVELIEKAGPEFVGATIDTGNSTWTLEDPVETFRNLAPYAICSGVRDSMVWPSEKGSKGPMDRNGGRLCRYDYPLLGNGKSSVRTPLYKSKQFPDLPGNSPTLIRIFGPPTQLSERMIMPAFSPSLEKEKHYLLFHPPKEWTRKKPSRNTSWQNWREVFPTAGKVWEWDEKRPRRRPVNRVRRGGQHLPNSPDSIHFQISPND
jgi:hypothetical protein